MVFKRSTLSQIFRFGKRFKEDAFKWTVSTAERHFTYTRGQYEDSNTYARGGSGEDDIDTEGGVEEDGVTGYFVSPEILYPHAKYPRIYCTPLGYLVSPSHSVYYVSPCKIS